MDNNTLTVGDYKILFNKSLGQGFSGFVFECENINDKNAKLCAKLINCNRTKYSEREKEISAILKKNSQKNKNIVKIIDVFELKEKDQVCIILERCDNHLGVVMKNRTPEESLEIIRQIVNGYMKLKHQNLIHRDLKPQNILCLGGYYKISDFGFTKVVSNVDQENNHTKLGTPNYQSPQILDKNKEYSNKTDIYSLGVIAYRLIFQKFPHELDKNDTLDEIKSKLQEPISYDGVIGLAAEIATLIKEMLQYEESTRISWQDLAKHPLINLDQNNILNQWKSQNIFQQQLLQQEVEISEKLLYTIKFLEFHFYLIMQHCQTHELFGQLINVNLLSLILCLKEHLFYKQPYPPSINQFDVQQEIRQIEVIEEMLIEQKFEILTIIPDEQYYIYKIKGAGKVEEYSFVKQQKQLTLEQKQLLYFQKKLQEYRDIKFDKFYEFCMLIWQEQNNEELIERYKNENN